MYVAAKEGKLSVYNAKALFLNEFSLCKREVHYSENHCPDL